MNYLSLFRSIVGRILSTSSKYPKKIFSCSPSENITMPPPVDPLPSSTTSQNHLPFPAGKPPSPFRNAINALFNYLMGVQKPPTGLTENLSPTPFQSSGNPCIDFFFYVKPYTPLKNVIELLPRAWAHDPLTTLKLICQLRRVGGAGKSDKEGFYWAALWLHKNHPKTLALNVGWFAQFGYMKDLPEILFRLLAGPDARIIAKRRTKAKERPRCPRYQLQPHRQAYYDRKALKRKLVRAGSREERISAEKERVKAEMEKARKARELRKNRRAEMARRLLERYYSDSKYRFLHDKISDFFAKSLKSDIGFLNSGEFQKIGLAAKWCPSLYSSFDRSTLLCETIAKRVFPRESDPSYSEIEEAHYSYRVRDRLRKEILVPLRKFLELPEVYMSSNRWGELPYERVASVAMKTYKKIFMKHDPERFSEFLTKVEEGDAKIAAGALLPHEILSFDYSMNTNIDKVAELQWKRMVDDMSKKGKLSNCLSVCDVSRSMRGAPMKVCVALGLLTSELSEEPWRGNVITFSANPQLHRIQGATLQKKVEFIKRMEWGMNTDFQKVFDRILDVAVAAKLEEEKMVKRVFVFSDMEFDEASGTLLETDYEEASNNSLKIDYEEASNKSLETDYEEASENSLETDSEETSRIFWGTNSEVTSRNLWETDYEVIQRKYKEKGYGSSVPEIVFWNLRDSRSTPVTRRQKGVALVSGFSKNLFKIFLEKDGVLNPEDVPQLNPENSMELAIAGEEYQRVRVFD